MLKSKAKKTKRCFYFSNHSETIILHTKMFQNKMQIMKNNDNEDKLTNIGVVRTDRLGDMVLTLPMCRAIKEVIPNCTLTLIARQYVKPLLYDCEVVDQIAYLEKYRNGIQDIYQQFQFDAVFFPRPRFNEVYYAYKKQIEHRIGSAYRWYSFLFTHKVKDHRRTAEHHESDYNVRLVSSFFGIELETKVVPIKVEPTALNKIQEMLETLNLKPYEFIVLHPGSGGSALNWEPVKFGELAQMLTSAGRPVVITGGKNETPLSQLIQSICSNVISFVGRLNLYEVIALISLAKGLVANSTGILHIASVMDIPVVGLFPNTPHLSAHRWGPIGKYSTSLSPLTTEPERMDDMSLITVSLVYQELTRVIQEKEGF